VNPAILTLARQRGELDCGGLRYVAVELRQLHPTRDPDRVRARLNRPRNRHGPATCRRGRRHDPHEQRSVPGPGRRPEPLASRERADPRHPPSDPTSDVRHRSIRERFSCHLVLGRSERFRWLPYDRLVLPKQPWPTARAVPTAAVSIRVGVRLAVAGLTRIPQREGCAAKRSRSISDLAPQRAEAKIRVDSRRVGPDRKDNESQHGGDPRPPRPDQ